MTHRPRIERALYHACSAFAILLAVSMAVSEWCGVRDAVLLGGTAALAYAGLRMRFRDDTRHAGSTSQSMHAVVAMALLYIVGTWMAVLACTIGSIALDLARGRRGARLFGNLPTRIVPVLAAGLTWHALGGGDAGALHLPQDYLPLTVSALVFALCNEWCFMWDAITADGIDSPQWRDELDRLPASLRMTVLESLLGVGVAVVFLENPWTAPVVLPLAGSMYVALLRGHRIKQVTERALETFASIVDERDRYTFEHSDRVCEYSLRIGRELGLSERRLESLYWTSRLHDLGKVAVDNAVLNKPDDLDAEEFELMKRHPEVSARILASFSFGAYDADVVRCHHERYDGRGYLGRSRVDVPLESFIIGVADAFDAMTSNRPYRTAMTQEEAFREIARGAGTHFHPDAAYGFLRAMDYDFERGLQELDAETPAHADQDQERHARPFRANFGDDFREVA